MRRRGRPSERHGATRYSSVVSESALPGNGRRKDDPYECEDDDFVTPMERAAFRERKTAAWARTMPLRIQQFLQMSGNDINLRIFRDVIVRFPTHKGTKEEVLAFLEPYGEVEYVSGPGDAHRVKKARKSSSPLPAGGGEATQKSAAGGEGGSSASAVGIDDNKDDFCHLVKFEEGTDAIRCFISLNGAMIDPEQHKTFVDGLKDAYQAVTAEQNEDGQPSDLPDSFEFPLMAAADGTRHIFITVDFFRLAFLLPTPLTAQEQQNSKSNNKSNKITNHNGNRVDRDRNAVGLCVPARSRLCTMFPSHRFAGGSIAQLHQQMRTTALKMNELYPLVVSRGIEWEEFCFLSNFFSFLHNQYIPTTLGEESTAFANAMRADEEVLSGMAEEDRQAVLAQAKKASSTLNTDLPELSVAGAVRSVYKGLQHSEWDAVKVLNWIDMATEHGERVLLEGRVPTGAPTSIGLKGLARHPLVRQFAVVAMLLLLLVLILRYLVD